MLLIQPIKPKFGLVAPDLNSLSEKDPYVHSVHLAQQINTLVQEEINIRRQEQAAGFGLPLSDASRATRELQYEKELNRNRTETKSEALVDSINALSHSQTAQLVDVIAGLPRLKADIENNRDIYHALKNKLDASA